MKIQYLCLLLLSLCWSCQKPDKTLPVVESITVNGNAVALFDAEAATPFVLHVNVSDDQALNQIKLSLHSADYAHSDYASGTQPETFATPNVGTWSLTQIYDVSGKSYGHDFTLSAPDSVSGNWHFMVDAIDENGNKAKSLVQVIHVNNAQAPTINLSSTPAWTDESLPWSDNGDSLQLSVQADDAHGLEYVSINITNESTQSIIVADTLSAQGLTHFSSGALNYGPYAPGTYSVLISARNLLGFRTHKFASGTCE
jgi:hypothetical protein